MLLLSAYPISNRLIKAKQKCSCFNRKNIIDNNRNNQFSNYTHYIFNQRMKEYKYARGALKKVLNVLVHKYVCLIEYVYIMCVWKKYMY